MDADFEVAMGSQTESNTDNGRGYTVGGMRYIRPVQIGQSFATTDNDGNDQEEMFVTRTKNLFSIDQSAEGAAAMR